MTVTVITPDAIQVNAVAESCFGQSFDITISNANSNPVQTYTYSTIGTVGSGLEVASASSTITVTPTQVGIYTYDVTASDNDCISVGSVTVTVKTSPSNTLATVDNAVICLGESVNLTASSSSNLNENHTYTQDFAATTLPSNWVFVNAGSGNSWSRESESVTGSGSMGYRYSLSYAANAWAFAPQLEMIAGQSYTISFKYKVAGSTFPERLKVTIGGQQTIAAHSTVLWDNNGGTNLTNTTWAQATITYTPSSTGSYSVGFNCYSTTNQYYLYVDDVSIDYTMVSAVDYAWSSSPAGFTSTVQNPSALTPTESTSYTVTATNINGCSQSSTVDVVVNQPSSSTTVISECDSYTWNGQTYTASGTYTFTTTNNAGCDSTATLNLTIKNSSSATVSVSECESYTWPLDGQTYTASGNYEHIIPNSVGCDSTVTLNLTILQPTSNTIDLTVCDPYTWPLTGLTYANSGTYTAIIPNAAGCDSVVTLNLVKVDAYFTDINVSSCESYTWAVNGQTYTSSGVYSHVLQSVSGCDSTVNLNLTITQPTSATVSVTACSSYTWPLNGETYTTSGQRTFTLLNAAQCDSVVTLDLTITQPTSATVSVTACSSYTWPLNGETYTTSGQRTFTLMNAAQCDSIVTLDLTITQPTSATVSVTACSSYTWPLNGETYTTSGLRTFTLMNAAQCDSVVTLDLTITQPTSSTVTVTACNSYTWPLNGETYTTSGQRTFTLMNAAQCDSVVTLDLTITQPTSSTVTVTACNSYTWPLNGETYTTSGQRTFTLMNAAQCDSIVTLDLTITSFTATATYSSNGEITASTGSSYQWINCATNAAIPGATSQTYTATENGSYAVIVTSGDCTETSACVMVGDLSVKDVKSTSIALFPNPTSGMVNITMSANEAVAEVFDMNGKILQTVRINSGDVIDLSSYERGVYSIKVMTELGTTVERVVKN